MIATNIMSCKDEKEEKDDKMEQKFRGKTLRIEKKRKRKSTYFDNIVFDIFWQA